MCPHPLTLTYSVFENDSLNPQDINKVLFTCSTLSSLEPPRRELCICTECICHTGTYVLTMQQNIDFRGTHSKENSVTEQNNTYSERRNLAQGEQPGRGTQAWRTSTKASFSLNYHALQQGLAPALPSFSPPPTVLPHRSRTALSQSWLLANRRKLRLAQVPTASKLPAEHTPTQEGQQRSLLKVILKRHF